MHAMLATLKLTIRRFPDSSHIVDAELTSDASAAPSQLASNVPVVFDKAALLAVESDPATYGRALSAQLFADPRLRNGWLKARAFAATGDLQLRLNLDAGDAALHDLHWERLRDPESDQPVALYERVRLVRSLDSSDLTPVRIPPRPNLHALVVVSNPSNLGDFGLAEVDVEGEIARARAALGDIPAAILGEHAEASGRATLMNITAALRDAPPIVILVAHGTIPDDTSYVWLEQDDGTADIVTSDTIVETLRRLSVRPLLFVLASCRGAGGGYGDTLRTLGPQLAGVGVPAVLAFQGDVAMSTIKTLLPTLITELRRDGQIDRALAAARAALGEKRPWWQAVLWLRTDGRLWERADTFNEHAYAHLLYEQYSKYHTLPLLSLKESPVLDSLKYVVPFTEEIINPQRKQTLEELVAQRTHLLITGESGSGKTTALWQLALSLCNQLSNGNGNGNVFVPFVLTLGNYNGQSLVRLLLDNCRYMGIEITEEVISELINRRKCLLLFDDFDLVPPDVIESFVAYIKLWTRPGNKHSVVVASRKASSSYKLGLPVYTIASLSREEASNILKNLPGLQQEDILQIIYTLPPESEHLISSPLTLIMLASVYKQLGFRPSLSRSGIYQQIVDGILTMNSKQASSGFDKSDLLLVLCYMAKWMQSTRTNTISASQLSSLLNSWTTGADSVPQLVYLKDGNLLRLRIELTSAGLLRFTPSGDIEFIHLTIQAYLAALTLNAEEIIDLAQYEHWQNTVVFWSSVVPRSDSNKLLEELTYRPILLGRLLIERNTIGTLPEDQTSTKMEVYLERYFRAFCTLAKQFSVILKEEFWSHIRTERLGLYVLAARAGGYTLVWKPVNKGPANVKWCGVAQVKELISNIGNPMPLPIWLLSQADIDRFHPYELAYTHIIWCLYNLTELVSWEGGIDLVSFASVSDDAHPVVAQIISRFQLLNSFSEGLPDELRGDLPFYAREAFLIFVEVWAYTEEPFVKYAILPPRDENAISVVPVVLNDSSSKLLFQPTKDGLWRVDAVGYEEAHVSIVEESFRDVLLRAPGAHAQDILRDTLVKLLPGFPPQA